MDDKKKKHSKKAFNNLMKVGIFLIIGFLAVLNLQMMQYGNEIKSLNNALSGLATTESDTETIEDQPIIEIDNVPSASLDGYPDVLAIVNGDEITKSEIEEVLLQAEMQGAVVSVEEILEQFIMSKILLQMSEERGYEFTTDDVENMFAMQGIPLDDVRMQIEAQGMNYNEFLESQIEDLAIMQMIEDEKANIEVTEEEALELYEFEKEFLGDMTFEELRTDIIDFIATQKAQEIVLDIAEERMLTADIQRFI